MMLNVFGTCLRLMEVCLRFYDEKNRIQQSYHANISGRKKNSLNYRSRRTDDPVAQQTFKIDLSISKDRCFVILSESFVLPLVACLADEKLTDECF